MQCYKITYKLITSLKCEFAGQQWRNRHREQTKDMGAGEELEGEMYGESNMETYDTICHISHISNGNLMYDSGNSDRGSVTMQKGGMG